MEERQDEGYDSSDSEDEFDDTQYGTMVSLNGPGRVCLHHDKVYCTMPPPSYVQRAELLLHVLMLSMTRGWLLLL